MNESSRKVLTAMVLLAVLGVATQSEAKKVPKNCDPELGCIVVTPKAQRDKEPSYRGTGR